MLRLFSGYNLHARAITFLRDQEAGELVSGKRVATVHVSMACPCPCLLPVPLHLTAACLARAPAAQVGIKRRHGGGPKEKEKSEKAVVRFATRQEAHRALRDLQGSFCGSNAVRLRVLQ